MSLVFKHISSKLEKEINGETIVDLTSRSFKDIDSLDYNGRVIIDDTMVMRPDLLGFDVNENMDFTNLLKTNVISNPFTLDTDDIILVASGSISSIQVVPRDTDKDSDKDIRRDYINPEKASETDPNIQKINKKFKELQELGRNATVPSRSNLPPNFNEFGNDEVEVINNKVKFAPGVARDASECSTEPISKAELISQILKNKLNNS
jgi:hypothetical protein